MPLLRRRPLLRAAAVGGGAYMMGKRRAEEQQEAYMQGQQSMGQQSMGQHSMTAAPQAGISSEDTVRLQELGKLHEQGILTDEEFAQQKARILGGA